MPNNFSRHLGTKSWRVGVEKKKKVNHGVLKTRENLNVSFPASVAA